MLCGGLKPQYKNIYYVLGVWLKMGTTTAQKNYF